MLTKIIIILKKQIKKFENLCDRLHKIFKYYERVLHVLVKSFKKNRVESTLLYISIKTFLNNLNNFMIKRNLVVDPDDVIFIVIFICFRKYFIWVWETFSLYTYIISYCNAGSLLSFLITLEHIYVCYYLVIILTLVYWTLYVCLSDFSGWTSKDRLDYLSILIYNTKNISVFFTYFTNKIVKGILKIYQSIYNYILKYYLQYFLLCDLYIAHNMSKKKNIKFFKEADEIINYHISIKLDFFRYYNIFLSFTLKQLTEIYYQKHITKYLYNITPNAYYYYNFSKKWQKNYNIHNVINYTIFNIRNKYNEILFINNFKHSGLFESVWAIFPSLIIISILIPSLILLYSFEDILNPYISIKVIGNQWYWTYEFDNWIHYKSKNTTKYNLINYKNEYNSKKIYVNYAFDSIIEKNFTDNIGIKRLLDVQEDQRLVLPINATIRFLVSSADVLHAFAVPELGFKVDAVPGRINQLLVFINRPGIYYGQCSELCGANHAFMPIVIQGVEPKTYLRYIQSILYNVDLEEYHSGENNKINKLLL